MNSARPAADGARKAAGAAGGAAAAAALTLEGVPALTSRGWQVLTLDDGLYILTAWITVGAISKPHFIAYNAGTSVLHLGPWREVVYRADKVRLARTISPRPHTAPRLALGSTRH